MAKQRLGSPRARLFVALDLPDEVRDGIVAWQRETLTDAALRVVRPESLHMTLVFLGYQPEKAIDDVAAAALAPARESAAPRISLLREPVGKPKGRPRLFAIEAEAPDVVELQAAISGSLEAARFHKPEKRPFWPHLTVARVKPEKRGSKRPARVEEPPGPLPEGLEQTFGSVRLRLYRSHLRPQGAEYESLAELEFKP
jgi:2'-5' RNA ligase